MAAILKVTSLKIYRLQPLATNNMHMKFETEIPKNKLKLCSRNHATFRAQKQKSNMAARGLFWNWHHWKSMGFHPYTHVLCYWSLELIFKAKLKLQSRNQKIQYGHQAAILKAASLTINRLLPMATINMHMKFEFEIPQQTWLTLQRPCRPQKDGQTDRQTDGWTDKVIAVYPFQLRWTNITIQVWCYRSVDSFLGSWGIKIFSNFTDAVQVIIYAFANVRHMVIEITCRVK